MGEFLQRSGQEPVASQVVSQVLDGPAQAGLRLGEPNLLLDVLLERHAAARRVSQGLQLLVLVSGDHARACLAEVLAEVVGEVVQLGEVLAFQDQFVGLAVLGGVGSVVVGLDLGLQFLQRGVLQHFLLDALLESHQGKLEDLDGLKDLGRQHHPLLEHHALAELQRHRLLLPELGTTSCGAR